MDYEKLADELERYRDPCDPLHEPVIAALRAAAALEKDAKRYRWLREKANFQDRNGPGLYWYLPRYLHGDEGERLDAHLDRCIDAALTT